MINLKKYFILAILFFLLVLSVNLFAKDEATDGVTITDAKQLKGIWEALYTYQQTPRQKRIDTFWLPRLEKGEFESKNEYQERVNDVRKVYENRVEKSLKKEIRNEQRFKNMVFVLKFTHIPYTSIQDSMGKYPSNTNESVQKPLAEEYYENKEKLTVLRKKIGTSGEDTGAAAYLGIPLVSPFFSQWKIEENNYSLEEKKAYFTFSLGEYNMEKERFPIIFPLSQFTTEEKEWLYYTNTLTDWEYYTTTYKKPSIEKTEAWLIKFDELPTYIPLPLDKAKTVRKNEKDLILELLFRPVSAIEKIGPGYIYHTLETEFISATFKEGKEEVVYAGKSGEWKGQEFVALLPEIDEAGWTMRPKYFDNDPLDGLNDPGSPSNPWIVKPSDPQYGPTYEVSSKYDYGNDFASRRDHYYGSLPGKVFISLLPTVGYLRWSSVFADRWAYGITALGLTNSNISGAFFAPGQPANPYIARRVDDIEE